MGVEQKGRFTNIQELGIAWPSGNLPPDQLASIIDESHTAPLRELIADALIREGKALWERIMPPGYATSPGPRSNQDIAIINGYVGAGRFVQLASEYARTGDAAVKEQIRPIENWMLSRSRNSGGTSVTDLNSVVHLEKDLRSEADEARQSLAIDPTGAAWLQRWLEIKIAVWNHSFIGKTSTKGKEDPEVIGFRKGKERYAVLYKQALRAGAKRDQASGKERGGFLHVIFRR